MKLLIITRNAWNVGNSTGNTLSNFFSGWGDSAEFAHLFCRSELPDNEVCNKYYRITETELVKNMLFKHPVGDFGDYEHFNSCTYESDKIIDREKRLYDFFRRKKWTIFLWVRELIWKIGKWKNKKLENFLNEVNPDIIFMPIHDCMYMHNVLRYCLKLTKAKLILYTGDDMYSLKQLSFSPLYWINRLMLRWSIRKSINCAELCYSMSTRQIEELSSEFGNKFKLIRKGIDRQPVSCSKDFEDNLLFIYTGNITQGRWDVLVEVGKAINKLNKTCNDSAKFQIYSGNVPSRKELKKIDNCNAAQFMGSVDGKTVREIQQKADVVLHVESFKLKQRLLTRLSFSTKLIDYLQAGKCILAVGWGLSNSIEYLRNNDIAIVISNKKMIEKGIEQVLIDKFVITNYSKKANLYGEAYHNIDKIRLELLKDFVALCN